MNHASAAAQTANISANQPAATSMPAAPIASQIATTTTTPRGESTTPARARAVQVEAAVKLENATGQAPQADATVVSVRAPAAPPSNTNTFQLLVNHAGAGDASGAQNANLSADEPQVSPSLVRGLSAMVNQRGGIMNMRLDPPELGQLRVQMMLARGAVTAEFQVTTPQAHSMLEKNLGVLRLALESQGLHVDRLVVHHAPSANHQSLRDDAGQSQHHAQRQQHDAANGQSRGRADQHPQQQQATGTHYRAADFAALMSQSSEAGADLASLLAASRG